MNGGRWLPVPDEDSRRFWEGCRMRCLTLPRCTSCGEVIFYPRSVCPECGSEQLEWVELSGKGTVYTFSVVYRPPSKFFEGRTPYVIALVELDEGPRLMSNIVEVNPESVRIGMRVECVFKEVDEKITLPLFRPSPEAHGGREA